MYLLKTASRLIIALHSKLFFSKNETPLQILSSQPANLLEKNTHDPPRRVTMAMTKGRMKGPEIKSPTFCNSSGSSDFFGGKKNSCPHFDV